MSRFIFASNQSLDGYIAGSSGAPQGFLPGPVLFRHFSDFIRDVDSLLYGRRMYEVMRYWDVDQPGWDELQHEFARAWRPKPKWVASRCSAQVGPNARLVYGDLVGFAAKLKSERAGEIGVAGAEIAHVLSVAGLIDEYRLYFRPQVFGTGKPYFAGPLPPLRLTKLDAIGDDAVRLCYLPA